MNSPEIKSLIFTGFIVLESALAALAAHAEPLLFTITGMDTATFVLDANPTPTSYSDYSFMEGNGVFEGTLDGAPHNFQEMTFYSEAGGGGISVRDASLCCTSIGPVVFSGTTKTPVFSAGTTFDLAGLDTLTISAVSSAPEPAVWTLMIVGLGLAGVALRHGQRDQVGLNPRRRSSRARLVSRRIDFDELVLLEDG